MEMCKRCLFVACLMLLAYLQTSSVVSTQESVSINGIAWSPTDNKLVVATSNGLWLYDAASLQSQPILLSECGRRILSPVFSPDSSLIAFSDYDASVVYVLHFETRSELITFKISGDRVTDMAFNSDNTLLAIATSETDPEYDVFIYGIVELWNLEQNFSEGIIQNNIPVLVDLTFMPDSDALLISGVSAGRDPNTSYAQLLEIGDSGAISELPRRPVSTRPVSNGSTIVFGVFDEYLRSVIEIWDVETAEMLREIQVSEDEPVNVLTLNSDASILVSGNTAGAMQIWDVETGTVLNSISNPTPRVTQLALMPEGITLASVNSDDISGSIQLWDTETGEQLGSVDLPLSAETSCDS